jgi:hypothetical protein
MDISTMLYYTKVNYGGEIEMNWQNTYYRE